MNPTNETQKAQLQEIGLIVRESMTTPSKPGKQPRPVWIVDGMTTRYEALFRDLGGHKYRGQWSFWDDPTAAILEHQGERMEIGEVREYHFERKHEKAERFRGYAENAQDRADGAKARVDAICERIPLGQPVLVGHHSERSARADQRRIERGMDKWCAESSKARSLSRHADQLDRQVEEPKSLAFIGNRIKELTAEAAKYSRYLNGQYYVYSTPGTMKLTDDDRARYELLLRDCQEQLEYWENEKHHWVETTGRVLPSPESIKVGMFVKSWAGWNEVLKVNKKSVTIKDRWPSGGEFTRTIEYTRIVGVKAARPSLTES